MVTDPTSRVASLETGDIDMMLLADPAAEKQLDTNYTILRNWDVTPAAMLTNVRPTVEGRPNPMSNVHARLAMAHAIDRNTVAATVGESVQVPTSPFSPDNPWGQPSELNGYPDYDPEAAERELAAYREETGEDTLQVTIAGPSDVSTLESLQLVQQQLAAVGIESNLNSLDATSLISAVVGAHYEVALFSNYSSPDPDQNHYFWSASTATGEGGININFTGFTNDTTEAALRQGRESENVEVRQDAYNTLVEEFNANAVNLWLYYAPISLIAAPQVRGLAAIGDVRFANFQPKTWLGGLWSRRLDRVASMPRDRRRCTRRPSLRAHDRGRRGRLRTRRSTPGPAATDRRRPTRPSPRPTLLCPSSRSGAPRKLSRRLIWSVHAYPYRRRVEAARA